jgi:hypothetical protein
MKYFYVYVDYTNPGHVPFYVGKGNQSRVKNFKRSSKHKNISNKHGIERLVIIETPDESEAFEYEQLLIAKLHTFVNDPEAPSVACNFTIGGEGASNPSAETRRKLSEASRRRKYKSHSAETKAKMSAAKRGKTLSEEQKQEISRKLSEAAKRRWARYRALKAQQNVDTDIDKNVE